MPRLRFLWLMVPALGLLELIFHFWFAGRAATTAAWRELAPRVEQLKRPGEPLLIAPEWAQPLARQAFGDEAFPLRELARPDLAAFRRVLEVSELGARSEEARSWRAISAEQHGKFTLRVLENPTPLRVRYRFVDHVTPADLSVSVVHGGEQSFCPFSDRARVVSGGLHGEVTFPRERFQCPDGEAFFVGVTIIDDQDYRPRQCIWAHPPEEGVLRLRFSNVPLGRTLRGFAGLSYFLFRDGRGQPITLRARAGPKLLGEYTHRDEWGFHGFSMPVGAPAELHGDVEFEIESQRGAARDFCFVAEAVE